ncbi:MAG: DUF3592 domain-containing protein [Gammaproteobacteria bacterium]|nr:DUF3592 domain-containing protein [Gammaproteobacteria bacterium]
MELLEYLIAYTILGYLTWLAWGDLKKQHTVKKNWGKVKGTIIESGVKDEMGNKPRTGDVCDLYSPSVKYLYRVGDREFTGTKITYNNDNTMWYSSPRWAASRGRKWKIGKRVDIYYHPDNPARACLVPVSGVPHLYLFFLVLWMAVMAFASIIIP